MLPPGKYYKAEAINVLLPGNAGDENKKSIIIKTKVTGEYYYRGNVIKRKL